MHGQETMFTLRFRPPSFSTALHEPSLSPSSERRSTTTLDRRVENDRDLTILPPNLPIFSFPFFFNFISNASMYYFHSSSPSPPSDSSATVHRINAARERRVRKARRSGIALLDFSRRESCRLRGEGRGTRETRKYDISRGS